jgi:hypothetical protein
MALTVLGSQKGGTDAVLEGLGWRMTTSRKASQVCQYLVDRYGVLVRGCTYGCVPQAAIVVVIKSS